MIDILYSELLAESITSDLKKQHAGEQWYSAAIAPTSEDKYYKQLLIFYKSADLSGGSQDNWFKDARVYALKYLEDGYDDLGHFDEFFHASSTYSAMLYNKKLSILNCVKNKKTDIGEYDTIDKEMRSNLRLDSAAIARGKMSIVNSNSELDDAKAVGKTAGYILYQKGEKIGLYTKKDSKMILPFQKSLKVGCIKNNMISAETTKGFTLFDMTGRVIAYSKNQFDMYEGHKIAISYSHKLARRSASTSFYRTLDSVEFYDLNGSIGKISRIEGLLDIDFRSYSPIYGINLPTSSCGMFQITIFDEITISEPQSFAAITDKSENMDILFKIDKKAIFDAIFS